MLSFSPDDLMIISTSKSKVMIFWLWMLVSDQNKGFVSCVLGSNAGIRPDHCGEEAELEGKLLIYQSIYIPALIYGHKLWGMTKRMK